MKWQNFGAFMHKTFLLLKKTTNLSELRSQPFSEWGDNNTIMTLPQL